MVNNVFASLLNSLLLFQKDLSDFTTLVLSIERCSHKSQMYTTLSFTYSVRIKTFIGNMFSSHKHQKIDSGPVNRGSCSFKKTVSCFSTFKFKDSLLKYSNFCFNVIIFFNSMFVIRSNYDSLTER